MQKRLNPQFIRVLSDRDAKHKWANQLGGGWGSIGGIGSQVLAGVVKNSVGRVFR
jgi:hypothetical protein